MVRMVGVSVIALACVLASRELLTKNGRRRAECEGFLTLLRSIRRQIGSFSAPLDAIYAEFSHPSLDAVGFTEVLRARGFAAALEESEGRLSVDGDVRLLLSAFSSELGVSYREDQLACCDRYIAELEDMLSSVRSEGTRRTKLACSLTAIFGAMLIIMLL